MGLGNISIWNVVIIVILVIVIFGGRKLPELGKGLGQGLANFRQAMRDPEPPATPNPGPAAGTEAETSERSEGKRS